MDRFHIFDLVLYTWWYFSSFIFLFFFSFFIRLFQYLFRWHLLQYIKFHALPPWAISNKQIHSRHFFIFYYFISFGIYYSKCVIMWSRTICVLRILKIHRPNRMLNVYVYDCRKEWNSKYDKKKLNENKKKDEK